MATDRTPEDLRYERITLASPGLIHDAMMALDETDPLELAVVQRMSDLYRAWVVAAKDARARFLEKEGLPN
jgi:hypothetical protein